MGNETEMVHKTKKGEEENTPVFADADGREKSITESRCMMKKKVEEVGL